MTYVLDVQGIWTQHIGTGIVLIGSKDTIHFEVIGVLYRLLGMPINPTIYIWNMTSSNLLADLKMDMTRDSSKISIYPSSHNHGSGKYPIWRLNTSSRTPFSTMIMGGRVTSKIPCKKRDPEQKIWSKISIT